MFGDLTKRVLMVYKADTASAQADIKKLSLTQKEHASALKKDLDAQNAGLEAQISKYASYAAKAAAAYGVIKVGLDSMEFYYERQELREKAQGHSIESLRTATRGLVSETELLKMAQAANHGVMKASSGELVVMAQAMDVFAERGHDAAEVQARFTEYLQTGKTKALKDYGLQIDEARGSVAQFKQVMEQLNVVAKDQASIETDARDKWDQSKIAMKDTIGQLRESGGALVEQLTPALIGLVELLNKSVEGWALIFKSLRDGVEWMDSALPEWLTKRDEVNRLRAQAIKDAERLKELNESMNSERAKAFKIDQEILHAERKIALLWVSLMSPEWQSRMVAVGKFYSKNIGDGMVKGFESGAKKFLGLLGVGTQKSFELDEVDATSMRHKKGNGPKTTIEVVIPDAAALREKYAKLTEEWKRVQADARAESVSEFQGLGFIANVEELPVFKTAQELADSYQQFNAQRSESFLASVFGPIDDFNMYANGFDLLKDASTAAFTAFITGSESIGGALRKALSSGLMSLSIEMFTQSLKHAAYAVGSLAMGNAAGAATHGKAAAMFLAGAVTVGRIGASMGGGSAATAGAGGNAGPIGPSTRSAAIPSGQGAGNGRTVQIIVGDDFADDSPRKRQQKAERLVNLGLRSTREVVFA